MRKIYSSLLSFLFWLVPLHFSFKRTFILCFLSRFSWLTFSFVTHSLAQHSTDCCCWALTPSCLVSRQKKEREREKSSSVLRGCNNIFSMVYERCVCLCWVFSRNGFAHYTEYTYNTHFVRSHVHGGFIRFIFFLLRFFLLLHFIKTHSCNKHTYTHEALISSVLSSFLIPIFFSMASFLMLEIERG